jgi:hypothetical protein
MGSAGCLLVGGGGGLQSGSCLRQAVAPGRRDDAGARGGHARVLDCDYGSGCASAKATPSERGGYDPPAIRCRTPGGRRDRSVREASASVSDVGSARGRAVSAARPPAGGRDLLPSAARVRVRGHPGADPGPSTARGCADHGLARRTCPFPARGGTYRGRREDGGRRLGCREGERRVRTLPHAASSLASGRLGAIVSPLTSPLVVVSEDRSHWLEMVETNLLLGVMAASYL